VESEPSGQRLTALDWSAIAVALTLPSAVTWVYFIWLDGAAEGAVKTAFGVGKTIQFLLPAVWVYLIQRERPQLARPQGWALLAGALFGLAVGAAMAALYFAWLKPAGLFDQPAAEVREKVKSFGVHSLAAYIALAIFYSALHSLLEEYYWRWFVFGQLARGCKLPAALAIAGLGFAAHHVLVLGLYFGWAAPLTWLFSAGIAIGGAIWSWLYRRGNSLAAPWLSHALVDAAIFAIGYDVIAM
jgi:membrane protease YdiL (CAAX protease family)